MTDVPTRLAFLAQPTSARFMAGLVWFVQVVPSSRALATSDSRPTSVAAPR